ncbi:DeoR/GlpR family DNA-binding transcription regulator [Paenibacillus polymyxa]|uniref:DeoR/GlpR family DNA-binding transcription regulator n=1 Tax=Paenibacillus polymyxa TaxID=1406 RepID=UPI000845D295|nr:DeoR/GlpR family DNA-binding transcription regulator [Paenibacillus polymyxa]AOK91751.1 DeoR family transcriptional regulator [Paenibacillus polymyxa]
MYQEERMLKIVDYLQLHKRISVDDICEFFNVSRDTARRDLVKLEEHQKIIRTRGGALLPTLHHDPIGNYNERLLTVSEEKQVIGQLAASMVRDKDRIILDSSTTVQACAERLNVQECSVITNSINQADVLSGKDGVSIHLLGGRLQKEHRYVYGSSVIATLSHYFVDKAFIGIGGISAHGLSLIHEEDGMLKHQMMKQADQVIILADHSKFGINFPYRFADLSEVNIVITDRLPEPAMLEILQHYDVEVVIPS